jgi:hypothetical protein
MRLVRISDYVWLCEKTVVATVDFPSEDRIVRRWMVENGVQEGDRIQPCNVKVHCADDPLEVWVVIACSGLVISISEPPIGRTLSMRPSRVDLVTETAQG